MEIIYSEEPKYLELLIKPPNNTFNSKSKTIKSSEENNENAEHSLSQKDKCLNTKSSLNEKKEILDNFVNCSEVNTKDQLQLEVEKENKKITVNIISENDKTKNNQNSNLEINSINSTIKKEENSLVETNNFQNFTEDDIKKAPTLSLEVWFIIFLLW